MTQKKSLPAAKKQSVSAANKKSGTTLTGEPADKVVIEPDLDTQKVKGFTTEAATVQQRLRKSMQMKRYRSKIERARNIARKRIAGGGSLKRRSLKRAKDILRKRLAGQRGQHYHSLSMQDRVAVDRLLDTKKSQIKKIAKRIYNKVRSDELRRYTAVTAGKKVQNQSLPIMSSLEMTFKDRVALREKAEANELPFEILSEVFARGVADWKNIETPTNTKTQHAFARVSSYISHGKAYDLDQDLRKE